jgi:hypothetical protein
MPGIFLAQAHFLHPDASPMHQMVSANLKVTCTAILMVCGTRVDVKKEKTSEEDAATAVAQGESDRRVAASSLEAKPRRVGIAVMPIELNLKTAVIPPVRALEVGSAR